MFTRIKLFLKHRHERKLYALLEEMLKSKDLQYEVKEFRVPCSNIYHYHTMPVVEVESPAYLANVFLNMQTDMHGKVVAVQVNFGYTLKDIGDHEEDATYSLPVDKVEGLLNTITDKMVTTWIGYREGLGL
jgi:hypothetical protein